MRALRLDDGLPGTSHAEAIHRFCRTCVFYHETRSRFLPGEAPTLVPPACYFQGRVMATGWCAGTHYQEDIP